MNQPINSQLLAAVRTNMAAHDLQLRLSEIKSALRHSADPAQTISRHLTASQNTLFLSDLETIHVALADKSGIINEINTLLKNLQELPTLTVSMAFTPSNAFTNELADKISTLIPDRFLLEIKTQAEIVAGAIIFFKGRCSDFSIAQKLKHYEGL